MTLRWMYDASNPHFKRPPLYAVGGYVGGDTPYVWTVPDWNDSGASKRNPIFTASNRADTTHAAVVDGMAFRGRLLALGVPYGVTVSVDIETAIYDNYLDELNEEMSAWKLMTYGSVSTLVQNMKTSGGWWGAHWTDNVETAVAAIQSGEFVALQWASATMLNKPYDLSVISDAVPLWTP